MSYDEKAEQLLSKLKEKDLETRKKYKDVITSQLDGSDETMELERNKQWYLTELEKLKSKYKKVDL